MTTAPRRITMGDDTPTDIRDQVLVLLDGDRLRDVIAYDVDEGWVMHVKHDDAGERVSSGDCYTVHKVYGSVDTRLG